jgi:hypothetical protein
MREGRIQSESRELTVEQEGKLGIPAKSLE